MEKAAYINSVSAYLPNSPIANEDMEDYIGKIGGNPSRVRSIVLRQNGIKTRYYGLDKNQSLTHSNAELAKEAVCGLFEKCSLYPACYGPCSKNSPQEDSNFRCLLSNLGLSKEKWVIYNFKLNLLQQEI